MEKLLTIQIERLPEGVYLATSENLQGLVAQGRTIAEVLEIARDVARKLIEAQSENSILIAIEDHLEYPLVISTAN
jgi:predicted RNase H-like HicB family nuclease